MIDFVDLHSHSMYSFLDGHPSPEEIVNRAASLGRRAHALTDHGSISGHVMYEKALAGYSQKSIGANTLFTRDGEAIDIKPIFGMEAYTQRDVAARGQEFQKKYHLSILSKSLAGYQNLLKLTTKSWAEGYYYRQTIDGDMLLDHASGLIILSGCESGRFMDKIDKHDWDGARELARNFKASFGDDFYIEIQHFPHMREKVAWAVAIADELGIKVVLTCDSHYIEPDGWKYQQFLWSIRDAKPVGDFKIEHAYLWEPDKLFAWCQRGAPYLNWQRIFENTVEVAEKCAHYQLPRAPHVTYPMEGSKIEHIRQVAQNFLRERGVYTAEYLDRLAHELDVIAGKQYEDYFLVVADMILWAKDNGIFVGPARGSSAGSLVCWALRITEIDPIRFGLLFERFVDPTRTDLPDIDCDFEDDRRHEVVAYMSRRWGAENVAGITTFARLQGKSALDDAARSYRIPRADIDIIKRHLVERSSGDQRAELTIEDTLDEFPEAKEIYERYPALQMAAGVEGRIRHTGKHAAGLVVTGEPLENYVAVIGSDDKLIGVDWRDSQYLNLMKIDVLGLKELTLYRLMCARLGVSLQQLYDLPLDDQDTFDGFNAHDFLGIFQFTGLATKGIASRVHFDNLVQIADVNALSRPGPLHAGATESYIRGKQAGSFRPILTQAAVQPIIGPTYGQIAYQEQVMQILRDVGSLSWQDVCDIRNIMGKSKGAEAMDKYYPRWEEGVIASGLQGSDAQEIWDCIRLYGKHSFNRSHALAYGLLAYWSMWFKRHFPTEFYWAQLCKTGDVNVAQRFILEAKRKGIRFGAIGLDTRSVSWDIANGAIVPGWQSIHGIGDKAAAELAAHGPYETVADIERRCKRSVVHSGIRKSIEQALGTTVDDLYGLRDWEAVELVCPARQSIVDVNEGVYASQRVLVAGRVTRINKKNRIEEYKDKGRDVTGMAESGKPMDYVILIIQDETDSTMVYLSPDQYILWNKEIWLSEGTFISVKGSKMPNVQLMLAQDVRFGIIPTKAKQAASRPQKDGAVIAQ